MHHLRKRIDRQLIILTVAFSSLLTLFISVVQLTLEYRELRNDVEEVLDSIALHVPTLANSVWAIDEQQIRLMLKALAQLPGIQHMQVTLSDRNDTQWAIGTVTAERTVTRMFSLRYLDRGRDSEIGTLKVVAGLDAVYQKVLLHAVTILISNAGKTFLVVIFMYMLMRRLVIRRIEQLFASVEQMGPQLVATGDTDFPFGAASKRDPDEIDMLQTAIEKMLGRIATDVANLKQARQDIETLNVDLERKVIDRTAQITAAKLASEAAYTSKSRFLAATNHDLRQPLQAIQLFMKALKNSGLNPQQQQIAGMLGQSVHTLRELLNAQLEISKLDSGRITVVPETLSVGQLLKRVGHGCILLAKEKGLRYRVHSPRTALCVETDPLLFQRIVDNLIVNAIKYTEHGGVLLGVRRHRGRAVFQVWDSGIGIAPDQLETIFEEYFQVDNAARNPEGGLGLGLAIVQKMAALLGTRVVCRSRPGRGSVFEFSLPLVAHAADSVP